MYCRDFNRSSLEANLLPASDKSIAVSNNNSSNKKRPLGISRRRWEDNIKMDLQEVGCGFMEWIELAVDRDMWRPIVNAVIGLRFS